MTTCTDILGQTVSVGDEVCGAVSNTPVRGFVSKINKTSVTVVSLIRNVHLYETLCINYIENSGRYKTVRMNTHQLIDGVSVAERLAALKDPSTMKAWPNFHKVYADLLNKARDVPDAVTISYYGIGGTVMIDLLTEDIFAQMVATHMLSTTGQINFSRLIKI